MKIQVLLQHKRCDKIVNFLLDKQLKVCHSRSMIGSSIFINKNLKKGIQVCVYNSLCSLSQNNNG